MLTQDFNNAIVLAMLNQVRRKELFGLGQELFNDKKYFEAHEAWEELWLAEQGRDRNFVQALIQVAGHFVHIAKGNWSGARTLAFSAKEKFATSPASNRLYQALDLEPLISALDYNLGLLAHHKLVGVQWGETLPPAAEAFLQPKLFERD